MKKSVLLLTFLLLGCYGAQAQLADGTVAPNFTIVDLNGNSHNLYNLLDQGKTVYIDFFATWCGPCWNYHQTHSLQELWEQYGPSGTNEAFVFGIEGDCSTNVQCISQLPGCNDPNNQGNWTNGVTYPLTDNCTIRQSYQVAYYPTIYMICPADKKVYEVGQQGPAGLWSARASLCPPMIVNSTLNTVQNTICHGSNTGSIDISVSGGNAPYTYQWSNGATTQDLVNVPAGTYQCTITSAQGWPGQTDAITVEDPPAPLNISVISTTPVGCNGVLGSVDVQAVGGWDNNYNFNWNNGLHGESIEALNAGTYTCTVTDDRGCTKTVNTVLAPATYPMASIAPPGTVTCATPTIPLNGSGVGGFSGTYNYTWSAWNGGNIVSGANTPNPIINAGGNYTMQISDVVTTCSGFASTTVSANQSQPVSEAGPSMVVSCAAPSVALDGSGSVGADFTYQWTAINGGHIESGGNTLSPVVDASGDYILAVTNVVNGCIQRDTTGVAGNNTPPTAQADSDNLTCVVSTVTLTAISNANNPVFLWTGPNGFESDLQNPDVSAAGAYQLQVTDPNTGCTNTASALVENDTEPPGATATGGTLTCSVTSLELLAEADAPAVTYAWTGPNSFESNLPNPTVSEAGDYSLVITDSQNGCTSAAATAVQQNTTPPVANAATPGTLNCSVEALVLDGSGSSQGQNFAYAWTTVNGNLVSGENTTTPTVDAPGAYDLLVTNTDNGCTTTASTTVIENAPVGATIEDVAEVLCHGGATGSATVLPAGGNAVYTYTWSTGETTATASNLASGTYTVVITDGEDCTASASVVITEPPVLAPNASVTHQTAANVNDGTATANPSGGSGDFTYLWSNGETTQTIIELAPGAYSVIVTDENGCTSAQTVTVNAFDCTISASAAVANITCFGANNGTASVALLGANDPVTYTWSNGANTAEVTNLVAGTYTVEILDNTNCADVLQVTIVEPEELDAHASATAETSLGANDGTATAAPTGGVGVYVYTWNNGETSQTISNLTPGTYTVTVQDENGCTDVQVVVVNAFSCAVVAQSVTAPVTCFGQNNGGMLVNLNGGTEPFTYVWSNGETTPTIQGLTPGVYSASVTDANGCGVVVEGTVTEPDALAITSDLEHPACAGEASGSIETGAVGGTGNYAYAWNTGENTSNLSDLLPGVYELTLTDGNGCTSTAAYTLAVADNIAPQIAAQNTTLELNASGTATATLQTLGASATDNCTVTDVSISPNAFDCANLGEHTVTITATDNAGNTSSATVLVVVADNMAPSVACPANITQCWYDNTVSYSAPVAQDNCLISGGNWKLEEGLSSGSEFPIGETEQTYSYTDASGNVGTCSFSVTITTPIQLGAPVVTHDVNHQGIGAIDISVTGGTEPYSYVWTNELGAVVGNTADIIGLHAGAYTVQIKDANGCLLATEAITVDNTTSATEPTWLRGVALRPNPSKGLTQIVFAEMPAEDVEINISDAIGRTVQMRYVSQQTTVQLDCTNLPEGIYFVRFRSGAESGVRKLAVNR